MLRKLFGWIPQMRGPVRIALMAALGALIGVGVFLVRASEAASYLSDDPKACINCHIMFPQYATWQHSSHASVANCNDCHVPHHNILAKYYYKAKDGSRHSALFTLRKEQQVIQAIPESRKVIQENCIRCHGRVMDEVTEVHNAFESPAPAASASPRMQAVAAHGDRERYCVDCHREVPHGRVHSLTATPNAAVPGLNPVTPPWLRQGQGR